MISKGFLRVLINGEILYLEDDEFHFTDEKQVFVIVDRLILKQARLETTQLNWQGLLTGE